VIYIVQILSGIVQIINMLVVAWCLLSWFPSIKWYEQPFKTLDQIVQPMIAPFRKLIPPIANIDFSPMIAIMVLQLLMAGLTGLVSLSP
jgi:YggT family protein